MPCIIPIKELRKTMEISEMAHKEAQPIFVTKNGYSDLVVMSAEFYDILMSKMSQPSPALTTDEAPIIE